jgi:enoyl-[acyl-carrier protein] reductase II
MAWIARAGLVSAVSAAGATGLLENSTRDLSITRREFAAIRAATDQPFGVNLPVRFLKVDEREESAIIDWLLEAGVRFVTTSAGDPTRYARRLKDAGVIVYHAVATLKGALKAIDAGCDGLIVEGAESAGIRGEEEVHSFVLLQAVREKVDVPIVAAGGVVDGRGMAAAFALGADGVAMGTRFVASLESPVHAAYKEAIVSASPGGTILTPQPPRANKRTLRTPFSERLNAENQAIGPISDVIQSLYVNGDVINSAGSAGETVGLIHEIKSAADIVTDTMRGFWKEVDRLAALRRVSAGSTGALRRLERGCG